MSWYLSRRASRRIAKKSDAGGGILVSGRGIRKPRNEEGEIESNPSGRILRNGRGAFRLEDHKKQLEHWTYVYNCVRSHQALEYRTPHEYCQHWLKDRKA